MTPYEKFFEAYYPHCVAAVIDAGSREPTISDKSEQAELINSAAEAVHQFYQDLSENPGRVSGKPTGEIEVAKATVDILRACIFYEIQTPWVLIHAIGTSYGLENRRSGDIFASNPLAYWRLIELYVDAPDTSVRNAAKIVGIDRKTVAKIKRSPFWADKMSFFAENREGLSRIMDIKEGTFNFLKAANEVDH